MVTGGGDVTFDETGNDEKKPESLYSSDWIPGVASSAQRIPYINLPVIEYNPNIENTSGAYWEPAAELKWYKNANNVLYKQKEELQLEVKVYKKIIKKLLKKQ
jgi:hypothetical protein